MHSYDDVMRYIFVNLLTYNFITPNVLACLFELHCFCHQIFIVSYYLRCGANIFIVLNSAQWLLHLVGYLPKFWKRWDCILCTASDSY